MDSMLSRVPLEIWQKIFQVVLASEHIPVLAEENPHIWSSPQTSSGFWILPRTPSTLSSVCTEWKSCAYWMPEMWNSLFVTVPKSMEQGGATETPPQVIELVTARLSLTQSMPLNICVVSDNANFGQSIIRAIIPFSRQWEAIHLYTPPEVYAALRGLQPTDFPNLLSFNIIPQNHSSLRFDAHDTVHFDQIPIFNEASSIRRFHTSLVPLLTSGIYPELEELHIRAFRTETMALALVLQRCSHLRVLTLVGFGAATYLPISICRLKVTLPNLETLILERPRQRGLLLALLVLPNIKSLQLGGCTDPFEEGAMSIFNTIERLKQRSRVESLECLWLYFEMQGMSMHQSTLVDFLRQNPLLRELRIDDTLKLYNLNENIISTHLFGALAGRNDDGSDNNYRVHGGIRPAQQPIMCPKLESLHLSSNDSAIFENPEMTAFLEARCMAHSEPGNDHLDTSSSLMPIVHLDISLQRKKNEMLPDFVKAWKEKGYFANVKIVD